MVGLQHCLSPREPLEQIKEPIMLDGEMQPACARRALHKPSLNTGPSHTTTT